MSSYWPLLPLSSIDQSSYLHIWAMDSCGKYLPHSQAQWPSGPESRLCVSTYDLPKTSCDAGTWMRCCVRTFDELLGFSNKLILQTVTLRLVGGSEKSSVSSMPIILVWKSGSFHQRLVGGSKKCLYKIACRVGSSSHLGSKIANISEATHTHTHVYMHMYIYIYVYVYVCIYVSIYLYMYKCAHVSYRFLGPVALDTAFISQQRHLCWPPIFGGHGFPLRRLTFWPFLSLEGWWVSPHRLPGRLSWQDFSEVSVSWSENLDDVEDPEDKWDDRHQRQRDLAAEIAEIAEIVVVEHVSSVKHGQCWISCCLFLLASRQ